MSDNAAMRYVILFILFLFSSCTFNKPDSKVLYNKARQELAKGNQKQALKLYDEVIQISPRFAGVRVNKGVLLAKMGRLDEAIVSLKKAVELDPKDPEAWYNLGTAYRDKKKYSEALGAFDQAVALDPKDPEKWFNRGVILGNARQLHLAIHSFDRAIAANKNFLPAYQQKTVALLLLGENKKALELSDTIKERLPNEVEVWITRGRILEKMGKYSRSLNAYEKALEISPNSPIATAGRDFIFNKMMEEGKRKAKERKNPKGK